MDSQEIIATIVIDGWFRVGQKGSHTQFKHKTKPGRLTVPHPKHGIPPGTLRSMERPAQIKPG